MSAFAFQVKPRDSDELKHFEVRHSFNDDQIEWFKAVRSYNLCDVV